MKKQNDRLCIILIITILIIIIIIKQFVFPFVTFEPPGVSLVKNKNNDDVIYKLYNTLNSPMRSQ